MPNEYMLVINPDNNRISHHAPKHARLQVPERVQESGEVARLLNPRPWIIHI